MKKIYILASILNKLGLKSESSFIANLSKKGMPLEGFVPIPIPKNEPTGYGAEEDEDGNIIENPIEMINRVPYIKKDQHIRSDYFSSEQQKADIDEWYSQLKELGDSIILIPFDRTDIDSNPEILDGLCDIFGVSSKRITKYEQLKDKVYMIGGSNTSGDLDTLKTRFPSLWYDINKVLTEKNIDESDAVYMLYNQQTNPGRLEFFTKDPFYLAHDIGHSIFDSGDDPAFRSLVDDFMQNILSLYMLDIDPEDEELQKFSGMNAYQAIVGENEDDYEQADEMQKYLPDFFNTTSGIEDLYGDVFAATTGGYLEFEFPQKLSLYTKSGQNLRATLSDMGKANVVASEAMKNMKYYVNPGYEKEIFKSGPLGSFKGNVVLQDI
jgi:hypothetical protein